MTIRALNDYPLKFQRLAAAEILINTCSIKHKRGSPHNVFYCSLLKSKPITYALILFQVLNIYAGLVCSSQIFMGSLLVASR